jgi:hypothetical protein
MTKVEELRDTIAQELSAFYEDRRMDNPTREAALFVDSLIAAAREEGADFMRARILEQSYLKDVFSNPLVTLPSEFYVVPASVLAPKETTLDKAGVILRGQHGVDW